MSSKQNIAFGSPLHVSEELFSFYEAKQNDQVTGVHDA